MIKATTKKIMIKHGPVKKEYTKIVFHISKILGIKPSNSKYPRGMMLNTAI